MERKIYLPSGEVLPGYWNEMGLVNLCRKFTAEIGNNTPKYLLPPIRVRYVLENNKFAYADFGDYFFWADNGLYVWHQEEKYAEDHNPDAVDDFFGGTCERRGYVRRHIFAGLDTGFNDDEGSRMFTGDIVQVTDPNGYAKRPLCLASAPWTDGDLYCFPLDNHALTLEMCQADGYHLKRVGTIFYQLDNADEPEPIWEKALTFNNRRWPSEALTLALTMAQYTPNYYQETWKYLGYEILGIEPFWKQ
jgi:hypothetical protein